MQILRGQRANTKDVQYGKESFMPGQVLGVGLFSWFVAQSAKY